MGFSPLANMKRRIPDVGRSSPRNSAVSGFTVHHNAGVDAFGQATAPGREVSANYWILNDGTILPNVDEDRRAWTSGAAGYPAGAAADHRNVTVEVSNSPEGVRSGSWAISAAAETALARLIGDVYRRYGLGKVTRGATRGVGVHRDWVPTACPGPYIMAHLGRIITAAEHYRTGSGSSTKGPDMTPAQAQQLQSIFDAIFRGGNSMKDSKKSISQSLADINQPVKRGGKLVPVRQDNADTNTFAREILAEIKSLRDEINSLKK